MKLTLILLFAVLAIAFLEAQANEVRTFLDYKRIGSETIFQFCDVMKLNPWLRNTYLHTQDFCIILDYCVPIQLQSAKKDIDLNGDLACQVSNAYKIQYP